jgi:hypothetical protein
MGSARPWGARGRQLEHGQHWRQERAKASIGCISDVGKHIKQEQHMQLWAIEGELLDTVARSRENRGALAA